jgi:hypothetical protein
MTEVVDMADLPRVRGTSAGKLRPPYRVPAASLIIIDSRTPRDAAVLDKAAGHIALRHGCSLRARFLHDIAGQESSGPKSGIEGLLAYLRRTGIRVVIAPSGFDQMPSRSARALKQRLDDVGVAVLSERGWLVGGIEIEVNGKTSDPMERYRKWDDQSEASLGTKTLVVGGYGYRDVPGSPGEVAVEPTEAQAIRLAVGAVAYGAPLDDVAFVLHHSGLPSPSGSPWTSADVLWLLGKQLYRGVITEGTPAMHPGKAPRRQSRRRRSSPPSRLRRVPALQIVDDRTWLTAHGWLMRRAGKVPP